MNYLLRLSRCGLRTPRGSTCFAVATLTLASGIGAKSAWPQTIRVGPNLLVSRDGPNPKAELVIASSPKNPLNFIGAAIVSGFGVPDTCKTYSSFDGGYTWVDRSFPELSVGANDPQMVFTADGSAFFATTAFVYDNGGKQSVIKALRSQNGGMDWTSFKEIARGLSPDHPQITASSTGSVVYMTVVYYPQVLALFRLDDIGGVEGPIDFAKSEKQLTNFAPLLSDSTVLLPYAQLSATASGDRWTNEILLGQYVPGKQPPSGLAPRKVADQVIDGHSPFAFVSPGVLFARGHGAFAGQLYALWVDFRSGKSRMLFSYSNDRGAAWTPPRPVDPQIPSDAQQFRPAMFVSDNGTIGITWFDTRDVGESMFNEYFTASVDGGRSFILPAKVSSQASNRTPKGNWPLNATIDTPTLMRNGKISTAFMSFLGRFPEGGDYMGLTADKQDVFHPFWTDARTGNFQVWTARVEVEGAETHRDSFKNPSTTSPMVVNQLVQLMIDPGTYDSVADIAEVPVRVRNVSDEPIYPPLTVEVAADAEVTSSGDPLAQILNSANGKTRAGALFDYSGALGDFHVLAPRAISEALPWKIHVSKRSKTYFDFDVNVHGSVQPRGMSATRP